MFKKMSIALLATTLLIVMVLAGCSKETNESTSSPTDSSASSAPDSKTDPVPLSVFMITEPDVDMNANKFTQEMNEKLNVKMNITAVSYATVKEKRQLALSSGDYSDVFLLNWADMVSPTEQQKLGKQGVYLPLNDLIDQYGPNIKKRMEEIPYYKKSVTAPDGNIYGLPVINECFHCFYSNKMWVNSDWLKKVGMDVPKTTDEFKEMLKRFKETDLNGNGKKDEVPLSGAYDKLMNYLMNAFIYTDVGNYLNVSNGKVDTIANKPELKAGLEFINSLFKEGLLDQGAFSQDGEALKQLVNRDPGGMVGAVAAHHPYVFVDDKNPTFTKYVAIPPLKGPGGVQLANYGGNGVIDGVGFAITSKANKEQQIAAIKLADYLATEEGTTRALKGIKGVDWTDPTPSDLDLDGKPAKYKPIEIPNLGPKRNNTVWEEFGPYVQTSAYRASWASNQDITAGEGYELRLYQASKLYEPYKPKETLPGSVYIDPSVVDEQSLLATNIKKYIDDNALKFIMGNKKVSSDWEAYVSGLNSLKLDRYLENIQKAISNSK